MNHLSKTHTRYTERGSAGIKLLLVMIVITLAANAGYHYIPTAYQGQSFKQDMETAVIQGVAMPSSYGKTTNVVRVKIDRAAKNNKIPYDAYINVIEKNKSVTARVFYVQKVQILPFGLYEYEYVFDHSATPDGFLTE